MNFQPENAEKIKLVIWDLDQTFWTGTLSEASGTVEAVEANLQLVKGLAARGIPSSICSKNNREEVTEKLREFGILDYFVFPSVNWEPKGERIRKIITDMALRPENVLFVDDNPSNRAEAEFVVPELMTAAPEILPVLQEKLPELGKEDSALSRLNQYKILEKKVADTAEFSSNLEFLKSSHIKVCIKKDVAEQADRIHELIQRSNQLNFTKKRITREALCTLAADPNIDSGYVLVSDDYGDYGIVGFYAVKDGELEHFLLSCRTMGMGIEQFLYAYLQFPKLTVVGSVSGSVSSQEGMPEYIKLVDDVQEEAKVPEDGGVSLLIKGSCDLKAMEVYIAKSNITEVLETNFVDTYGNQVDYYNHTVNILNTLEGNEEKVRELNSRYPFISREAIETSLLTRPYDYVFLSVMMDATLAVYRRRQDGLLFAYGLYNQPMTDPRCWESYLNKEVMTARNTVTREQLEQFAEEFEQIEYTPEMIAENTKRIIEKKQSVHPDTKFLVVLLPELPYDESKIKLKTNFGGKEEVHRQINQALIRMLGDDDHVYFLDVNQFIKSQWDYFDSINHYSKLVYFKMASEAVQIINSTSQAHMKPTSKLVAQMRNIKRMLYKKLCLEK